MILLYNRIIHNNESNELLIRATTQTNVKGIMLSENCQTQKAAYYVMIFMQRQNYRNWEGGTCPVSSKKGRRQPHHSQLFKFIFQKLHTLVPTSQEPALTHTFHTWLQVEMCGLFQVVDFQPKSRGHYYEYITGTTSRLYGCELPARDLGVPASLRLYI